MKGWVLILIAAVAIYLLSKKAAAVTATTGTTTTGKTTTTTTGKTTSDEIDAYLKAYLDAQNKAAEQTGVTKTDNAARVYADAAEVAALKYNTPSASQLASALSEAKDLQALRTQAVQEGWSTQDLTTALARNPSALQQAIAIQPVENMILREAATQINTQLAAAGVPAAVAPTGGGVGGGGSGGMVAYPSYLAGMGGIALVGTGGY